MRTLSQNQVLALHTALIQEFGGTDGVRDMGCWNLRWLLHSRHLAENFFIHPYRPKQHSWAMGWYATCVTQTLKNCKTYRNLSKIILYSYKCLCYNKNKYSF